MTMTNTDDGTGGSAHGGPRGSRWSGAAVGFSVAFVAALIAFGFDAPFLALGIPAATIAGWMLGPQISAADGVLGMSVAMGVVTVAVADALVVIASAAASLVFGGSLVLVAGSLLLWVVGFVIYGLPMMAITVPCGVIWAELVRALARENGPVASESEREREPLAA